MSTVTSTGSCLLVRAYTHGVPPALAEKVGKAEQAAANSSDTATISKLAKMETCAESNYAYKISDIVLNAAVGVAVGVGAHAIIGGALGTGIGCVGMAATMPTLNKWIQEKRLSCYADQLLAPPAPQPAPAPQSGPAPAHA